jgi:hypothetical protein
LSYLLCSERVTRKKTKIVVGEPQREAQIL